MTSPADASTGAVTIPVEKKLEMDRHLPLPVAGTRGDLAISQAVTSAAQAHG